jgi:hypothetical protein
VISGSHFLRSLEMVQPETLSLVADSEARFWKASNCADRKLLDQLGDAELLPAAAIIGRSSERCGISARCAVDLLGTDPMNKAALVSLHDAIAPNRCPRGFRTVGLRVTGDRPGVTAFFPPHPNRIDDLIAELSEFLASYPDGFVRAAVGFGWFEWIHPFQDGNGRIGRVLLRHLLSQSTKANARNTSTNEASPSSMSCDVPNSAAQPVTPFWPGQPGPIGLAMRHDQSAFNAAHRSMRNGDFDSWLSYFAARANECANALAKEHDSKVGASGQFSSPTQISEQLTVPIQGEP